MACAGLIATFLYLTAMSDGATAMSRVVASKVCSRAGAKITSTADMLREAAPSMDGFDPILPAGHCTWPKTGASPT
jgi:hypothetical protein